MIRLLQGDCRELLRGLPDGSVQMCVTSPPYYGLRDYGTGQWEGGDPACDHIQNRGNQAAYGTGDRADRANPGSIPYTSACGKCGALRLDQQIGLEQSPAEYVAQLVEVFRELRRVLADDGVLFLNLGDSYAGSRCGGHSDSSGLRNPGQKIDESARAKVASRRRDDEPIPRSDYAQPGLKPKDLIGIPWRVAFALQADGWWLRQDIIWAKPNPMPESTRDRCTKAHEYLFLLSKAERYFYDADAIAEPATSAWDPDNAKAPDGWDTGEGAHGTIHREGRAKGKSGNKARKPASARGVPFDTGSATNGAVAGSVPWEGSTRNRRSVWTIATAPFKGPHFATFPPALVEPCILAGTSERGHCPSCGARWRRQTEPLVQLGHTGETDSLYPEGSTANRLALLRQAAREQGMEYTGARRTVGWEPGCACGLAPVPDVVLDPFGGAGTTGLVADRLQRDALLIELSPANIKMTEDRIRGDAPLFAELSQ